MSGQDVYRYFRIEAAELLELLYSQCLLLEKDSDWKRPLDELKRAAHSLKGACRLVELFETGNIAHTLEDELTALEAAQTTPNKTQISALLKSVDLLKAQIDVEINCDSKEIEQSKLTDAMVGVDPPGLENRVKTEQKPSPEVVRVSTETLDELGRDVAQVLELGDRMALTHDNLQRLRKQVLATASAIEKMKYVVEFLRDGPSAKNDKSQCVSELQSQLRTLNPEQLRANTRESIHEIEKELESLSQLGERLHSRSLDTKLASLESTLPRFEKVVRDTAVELNKEVILEFDGAQTRIDRVILQSLVEPINHLLRNAVAHGVESAKERTRKGKNTTAKIRLSFEKQGDGTKITIEDDGRGISIESIREKAVSRGLNVDENDDELLNLIFQAGFSTSESVSQISGRGVGLDVVYRSVQSLRGSIRVESEQNSYCRFFIELPSNLDVMDVFVLSISGQELLIPMQKMVTTLEIEEDEIVQYSGKNAVLHEGKPIPLYSLHSAIGLSETPNSQSSATQFVAVLKGVRDIFAVAVDKLKGTQRIVIKNVGPRLKEQSLLLGAGIMTDGRPAFLLETSILGSICKSKESVLVKAKEDKEVMQKSVLVVDDSLTTRMLEKAVLEEAGYSTSLARDGKEALGLLAECSYDLIIVDFEMPGMTGIELSHSIRKTRDKEALPIIMLTSRAADEDKRKGMSAGVQAYLVKGNFDQAVFIDTVESLIGEARELQ